ncbi:MAG TPA: hypothetical protein VK400_15625 [Pyrinomonadaceae bacterium]|nr:hypothetical protein [Pyrinomonadaceae bacterium]
MNANVAKKPAASKFDAFDNSDADGAALRKKLDEIEKRMLQILSAGKDAVSVFELREVIQRYAGLTLAAGQRDEIGENEREVFRIVDHQNAELGAKCLHRRNRLRLGFHQRLASRDFLRMLAKFSFFEAEKLRALALEFATLLDDGETRRAIENLFAATIDEKESLQINHGSVVNNQGEKEEVVWNAKERKQPLAAATTGGSPISVP